MASIEPVVLRWAVSTGHLVALISPQPDPEVSIRGPQLLDKVLDQLLLLLGLDAEQLSSITPTGAARLLKVHFASAVLEVGDFIARTIRSASAYPLSFTHNERRIRIL